jgi:hypothetical protein
MEQPTCHPRYEHRNPGICSYNDRPHRARWQLQNIRQGSALLLHLSWQVFCTCNDCTPIYLSIFIPIAPTWSIVHPRNASFHFSSLILDNRQDFLDRQSARRKAATNTGQYKHRINANKHPCLEWDSNPRSQHSSGRDVSWLRPRGHCDRQRLYTYTVNQVFDVNRYKTFAYICGGDFT